LQRKKKLCN